MYLKAFRDPIHNIIHFDKETDKLLLDLIDTAEFQRLRHINQLGISSFTYIGASHTRFAHSIGVTHLMKRFIDKIISLKDPAIKGYQDELKENRVLALVAALLHDIGHGPFSHALEKVTEIDHENVSIAIINGNTEINQLLETYQKGFSKEVSDVISRTHTSQVVVKLLSSQLDVDRIDYLIRDSKMTGAGYGTFDLEWLINVLRIGKYQGKIEVGLDLDKGLSIAEDFVMARYYMYKHVYFHKATRSVEVMIRRILTRAQLLSDQGKLTLNKHMKLLLSKPTTPLSAEAIDSFLQLTEHTLWHYIYEWRLSSDELLRYLCDGIARRKLYKSIETPRDQMEIFQKAMDISKQEDIPFGEIFVQDDPSTSYYKDSYLSKSSNGNESDTEKEASEQIVLFDKSGEGFELSTKSIIIEKIRNKIIAVSRLYFDGRHDHIFRGGK